jgi:adenylate cyclase
VRVDAVVRTRGIGAALLLPLAGLVLLLAVPDLDVRWQHQPSHFWLVLVAAVINAVLGLATGEAAGRRGDTRIFLMSMALTVSAAFLALHALATPRVVLDGPNAGFTISTPVGIALASVLAAASVSRRFERAPLSPRAQRRLRAAILLLVAAWAVASLARVSFLDAPTADEAPLLVRVVAPIAIGLYAVAAWRYLGIYRERRRPLPLAIAVALVLLAEAMVAIVFARTWHATWWEWHVLMLLAFGTIFLVTRSEYRRTGSVAEAFTSLYQAGTLAVVDQQTSDALARFTRALRDGAPLAPVREQLLAEGLAADRIAGLEQSARELRRVDDLLHTYVGPHLAARLAEQPDLARLGGRTGEVTVLFADLVGFTSFSETRTPEAGMDLLNTYWAAVVPTIVDEYGGYIERFAGDGILVIFNALGDQPDHPLRAVRAALFVQEAIGRIARPQPDWPLFRIGINTGPAVLGNVGAGPQQSFTVIGDTANTAARFEAEARPGHVLIGDATHARVRDDVEVVPLGALELKGKALPQEVYEVVG